MSSSTRATGCGRGVERVPRQAVRFPRNFWKHRNHAKAYRVAVGHLSQTLQLCATRAGLAPFITAAINEVDIESAFGLTGYLESPLAVRGFGLRAAA